MYRLQHVTRTRARLSMQAHTCTRVYCMRGFACSYVMLVVLSHTDGYPQTTRGQV